MDHGAGAHIRQLDAGNATNVDACGLDDAADVDGCRRTQRPPVQ
jgi:hypothetical protein